jgi:hypothetical protein
MTGKLEKIYRDTIDDFTRAENATLLSRLSWIKPALDAGRGRLSV